MFARTKRLTLRPAWPEDAPALAAAIGHEAVVRNLARAPWPYRLEDAQAFIALPRAAKTPNFVITAMEGGAPVLIGGIGLLRNGDVIELGYWLTPSAWGRGYATEAGRAVIDLARDSLGVSALRSRYHVGNPASGRVLRKLGFVETGVGRTHSLARHGEIASVEMALDFTATEAPQPAMAA